MYFCSSISSILLANFYHIPIHTSYQLLFYVLSLIWAGSSEKMPSSMLKMCGFTSSCTCAKSHPGICSPFKQSVVFNDSVCWKRRPWSDCAHVQYDLAFTVRKCLKTQFLMAWPIYHDILLHILHLLVTYQSLNFPSDTWYKLDNVFDYIFYRVEWHIA